MAFVRRKGNQLAVVHGVRDPETQQVEQRTLFTLYSKAEALAAVGEQAWQFRQILENDHPGLRFDFDRLTIEIRECLHHLPDLYSYQKERLEGGFRSALCGFAKELMVADPQMLVASARLLQANRYELTFLRDLIDWRLKTCDTAENEWNQDNPFYWRTAGLRRNVPGDEWEKLSDLFANGQYDETEALARLLIECWPNFAEGFNYLGLVALERDDYVGATSHFDQAIQVGRTLFPKRIQKDLWWSDHDTRPYIRAITYKAQALNRAGDYPGAQVLCDRLEKECFQDITAATMRIPIYLNSQRWEEAKAAASYVRGGQPASVRSTITARPSVKVLLKTQVGL